MGSIGGYVFTTYTQQNIIMITSQILVKPMRLYWCMNPYVIDDSTNGVWCMADTTKVGISLT